MRTSKFCKSQYNIRKGSRPQSGRFLYFRRENSVYESQKTTALYCRLSRYDELVGDSNRIKNQRDNIQRLMMKLQADARVYKRDLA